MRLSRGNFLFYTFFLVIMHARKIQSGRCFPLGLVLTLDPQSRKERVLDLQAWWSFSGGQVSYGLENAAKVFILFTTGITLLNTNRHILQINGLSLLLLLNVERRIRKEKKNSFSFLYLFDIIYM